VVTDAAEDYLKAIFALRAGERHATTTAIAERLGITAPSVSAMLKRLEADRLVRRPSPREIDLTPAGERAALRVVRRHRLLETFLFRVLDVPWDEVHDEAERLEHAVSERLEGRIDTLLGFPSRDPHGDPIPRGEGHDDRPGPDLAAAPAGTRVRVERVSDRDPEALRYLGELGIRPDAVLTVVEHAPFGGPTWVELNGRRHALPPTLTHLVSANPVT
jgi:DtxR family transcriptional regulator, Mn-dependent transcriptional regulator